MILRLLVVVAWVALYCGPVEGQLLHASGSSPSFAVASIRPSGDDEQWPMRAVQGTTFQSKAMTLREVISYAYGVTFDGEMVGGPKWIGTERFDIEAKPDEEEAAALKGMSNDDRDEQMRLMVQSLLQERFGLRVRFEKRELPVYELVVAKGGLKCAKIAPKGPMGSMAVPRIRWNSLPPPIPPPGEKLPPPPSAEEERRAQQTMHIRTNYWPFWLVVTALSHEPELNGRPVVDKTGIEGNYDCEMKWSREGSDGTGPSFFTALEEQMGLKMVSSKGMVEVLVVESAERPSAN